MHFYRELLRHRIRARNNIETLELHLKDQIEPNDINIDKTECYLLREQITILKKYIELLDESIKYYENCKK